MEDQPTTEHTEQGRLIWDMPKLRRWVEDGCDPSSPDCIDGYTLRRIEEDGLIELDDVSVGARSMLSIKLTGMGEFEADRLEYVNKRIASEEAS